MSQNIYTIQLLNELHNHFPELLYNHRRFQNVQDVLGYIRSVADISPFERGMNNYVNRPNNIRNRYVPPPPPLNVPSTPIGTAPILQSLFNNPNATFNPTVITATFDELPQQTANTTTRIRMPVNNINTGSLMNTLLSGMLGEVFNTTMMSDANLQSFLNQRVPVYPTNEEIDNSSTLYVANRRLPDLCAICQDEIEPNQHVRRLTHCNHYYHKDCIDTWFQGNVHCPTCRHDIREVSDNDNNRNNDNRSDRNNMPPPVPENHRRMNIRRSDNS